MEDIRIIITDNVGNVVSDDNQYTDYSFDSDYNTMAADFSVTLVDPSVDIKEGDNIQFWVNNEIQFLGEIQRFEGESSKDSDSVRLSGKNRAAILVENYCNNFKDFNNKKPTDIIDTLIAQTNFYTKPKGVIDEVESDDGFSDSDDIADLNAAVLDDVDSSKTISQRTDVTVYDADFLNLGNRDYFKINIGDTVFDKINQLVRSYGFDILYENDGTLYIGDLNKKRYDDQIVYNTSYKFDGTGNVLSSNVSRDISGRYSSVLISVQVEDFFNGSTNSFKVAKDSSLPSPKFFAAQMNNTRSSAEKLAIQEREDQRIEGFNLTHTVSGHVAENGEPWNINRFVSVVDDRWDVRNDLVLYGRTFNFSESEGRTTTLRMSEQKIMELLEL